jgi:hypothetical protein
MMAMGLVLRVVPLLFPCCAGTRRGQAQGRVAARSRPSRRRDKFNFGYKTWRRSFIEFVISNKPLAPLFAALVRYAG